MRRWKFMLKLFRINMNIHKLNSGQKWPQYSNKRHGLNPRRICSSQRICISIINCKTSLRDYWIQYCGELQLWRRFAVKSRFNRSTVKWFITHRFQLKLSYKKITDIYFYPSFQICYFTTIHHETLKQWLIL